jgi:hypothetical protein
MKKYIKLLIIGFSMLMLPAMEVDAKSRSFSSGRSSFSSSRSSSGFSSNRSSSSKPSSGFSSSSSKPSAVKPSSGFSSSNSKPNNVAPKAPAQKSAFEIAQQRKTITPPPPKDIFVNDFKKNNASKYPSTFNTPPATRPSYIPPVINRDGKERKVEYNQETRSYGFFDDLGKFMVYDAITDIALGAFQKEQTVYVQKTEELKKSEDQQTKVEENQQKIEEESNTMLYVLLAIGGIFLAIIIAVFISL